MKNLTTETQNKISVINQAIIDIIGCVDKSAFNELMKSNNPLESIKFAYKMTCKQRDTAVNNRLIAL